MNNDKLKLTYIKFTHHYGNMGLITDGDPLSTSVELIMDRDNTGERIIWKKVIAHTYILEKNFERKINTHEEELQNPENIINLLEEFDLPSLKNNYFTDENPIRYSYWELEYNKYFKIVGTYDNEIDEIKKIKEIINFNEIKSNELKKVKGQIKRY